MDRHASFETQVKYDYSCGCVSRTLGPASLAFDLHLPLDMTDQLAARCGGVLIIEDDKDIRISLKELLEFEGYQVFEVENGAEGLTFLEHKSPPPCLILLDLFMPVMNGLEFLKKMNARNRDTVFALPVAIISAAPPEGGAAKEASLLASLYLKKPIDVDLLLTFVARKCPKGLITTAA